MVDFNDRRTGTAQSPSYGAYADSDKHTYTKAYRSGWRHSSTISADPDNNPHQADHFLSSAWEDGYMDNAVGRDKYALKRHRFGTGDPVEGY